MADVTIPEETRAELWVEYLRTLMVLARDSQDPLQTAGYIHRIESLLGPAPLPVLEARLLNGNGRVPEIAAEERPALPPRRSPPPYGRVPAGEVTIWRVIEDAIREHGGAATTDEMLEYLLSHGVYTGLDRVEARKRMTGIIFMKKDKFRSIHRGHRGQPSVWGLT